VADTAKMVNISGEPTLVRPEKDRRTLMDLLLGDVSQYIPTREKMMEQEVGFYYLWK
jgi:protease-4